MIIASCSGTKEKNNKQTEQIESEKNVEINKQKVEPVEKLSTKEDINEKEFDYSNIKYRIWELSTPSLTTCRSINSNIISSIINKASAEFILKFNSNYDSCTFIGWNESYKSKVKKNDDSTFRVENGDYSYWDFKFLSGKELFMRSVFYKKDFKEKFTKYQGVDTLLSDYISIEKRITKMAKELIIGKYNVVFSDSLGCESEINFDDSSNAKGFIGFTKYRFKLGDWEYPSDYNELVLLNENWGKSKFAFEIIRDTLYLKEIGKVYTDPGSGFHVRSEGKTRLKLIKKE